MAVLSWRLVAPTVVVSVVLLGLIPLILFAWQRGGQFWPDAYVWRVTRFTLLQASLSTVLSVAPAIAMACAIVRTQFRGKSLLLSMLALPQSLPVIIAIFGMTALYGQSGAFGGWFDLYGLNGILLVHVFFNLPMATRVFVEALNATPQEPHRLAAQLNFSNSSIFRHVDWPAVKTVLPHVTSLVFLLCSASFVTVLVLGGPQATTLEVAIYQSLRMDFDVTRALTLSCIQILISAILVFAASKALTQPTAQAALLLDLQRFDKPSFANPILLFILGMLVLPVYVVLLIQGVSHVTLSAVMAQAFITSILIACFSVLITISIAWGMAKANVHSTRGSGLVTVIGLAGYITPPAVIATGWFLAMQSIGNGLVIAFVLIAVMNMLMALPFVLAFLVPAMSKAQMQHERLCLTLNIRGWERFWLVDLPSMKAPLTQAGIMAFVLSLGDLTAITLLGSNGLVTLPSLIQQQMGHYNFQSAGGTALLLALICATMTFAAHRFAK